MEDMSIRTDLKLSIEVFLSTKDSAEIIKCDKTFSKLLNQWHSSKIYPRFVELELHHQYATDGFQLRNLKGDDFTRAQLAKRACARNGNFRVMLVNVEARLRDKTDMNKNEKTPYCSDYKVKAGANKLIVIKKKHILRLLRHQDVEKRDDDEANESQNEQLGGFCWPNVRSTMVIVRRDSVASYLLPSGNYTIDDMNTLLDGIKDVSSPGSLLVDVYKFAVRSANRYHFAGKVAVAACRMKNTHLFNEAASTSGLDELAWTRLGLEIDLERPPVSESSIVKALLRSLSVYEAYQVIKAFGKGLAERAAARYETAIQDEATNTFGRDWASRAATLAAKRHEITVREGWLTSVLMMALERKRVIRDRRDARALVEMISRADSINQFIIYQGVRKHLTNLPRSRSFASRLFHETTLRFPASELSRIFLQCINRTAQEHHVWENHSAAEENAGVEGSH